MTAAAPTSAPMVRRVRFDWDAVDSTAWHHELPEFGAGANAVSLLMPHAEPFVIDAVRYFDDGTHEDRTAWMDQEAAHHGVHARFNRRLTAASRTARVLDRIGRWMFGRLGRRSPEFALAFAAAFEIVAFCSARWAESGLRRFFGGADPEAATIFLWHLAEEIEHKGIVHDLMADIPDARRQYRVAVFVACVVLLGFTAVGGVLLFASSGRRALNPLRWARLVGWGVSFAFVVLPVIGQSLGNDFHPDDLVDPPWMASWLREFDPATNTISRWDQAGLASPSASAFDAAA